MCKHQLACRSPAAGPLAPAGSHSHLLAPLLSPQRALPDDKETEAGTCAWGIVVLESLRATGTSGTTESSLSICVETTQGWGG